MTYQQWLLQAVELLRKNTDIDPYLNPKTDANILLQTVVKRSKSAIFAFGETLLSAQQLSELEALLARRLQGEPIAYILEEREFWSLPLKVSPATLIPRPDTERLVEVALAWADKRLKTQQILHILDLGTGTGAIALALASELGQKAQILGVDFNKQAVELAKENQQRLGFSNVYFRQSDWFENLENQRFDLIVSNPPYIDEFDENLKFGDVRFEPLSALVAPQKGLADLQKIIENAPHYLEEKGALILEHGFQQGQNIRDIFQQNQWVEIKTVQDYANLDRLTKAVKGK